MCSSNGLAAAANGIKSIRFQDPAGSSGVTPPKPSVRIQLPASPAGQPPSTGYGVSPALISRDDGEQLHCRRPFLVGWGADEIAPMWLFMDHCSRLCRQNSTKNSHF